MIPGQAADVRIYAVINTPHAQHALNYIIFVKLMEPFCHEMKQHEKRV